MSVCAGDARMTYRFGKAGAQPELAIAVAAGQPGVWQGGVVGGGPGGQQTHIRFANGGTDYIVYSAGAGAYTDSPGRRWSGAVVYQGDREVRRLDCPVQSYQTEIAASQVPDHVPQDPEPRYDAWF